MAAVHVDRLTIHVQGEVRPKEHSDSSYLFRLRQTSRRHVCAERVWNKLRELVGEYVSNELDVPYYVTLAGDHLVLHPPKMPERPLSPIKAELFIGEGFRVRFMRNVEGRTSGFLMSGPWNRTKNVRFERAARPEHFLLIR